NVSTNIADKTNMNVCLPRGTGPGLAFYRIAEGGAPSTGPGTVGNELRLLSPIIGSDGGLQLRWNAVVGQSYQVQSATNIVPPPPVTWTTLKTVTATNNLMIS